MRTEREIRAMIDKYMSLVNGKALTSLDREWYYGIIDTLLWVIGDESGKAI